MRAEQVRIEKELSTGELLKRNIHLSHKFFDL